MPRISIGSKSGTTFKPFYTLAAIFLRKSSEPPSAAGATCSNWRHLERSRQVSLLSGRGRLAAAVDASDPQTRMIGLTGPRCNSVSFKLGDAAENIGQIRKAISLLCATPKRSLWLSTSRDRQVRHPYL